GWRRHLADGGMRRPSRCLLAACVREGRVALGGAGAHGRGERGRGRGAAWWRGDVVPVLRWGAGPVGVGSGQGGARCARAGRCPARAGAVWWVWSVSLASPGVRAAQEGGSGRGYGSGVGGDGGWGGCPVDRGCVGAGGGYRPRLVAAVQLAGRA